MLFNILWRFEVNEEKPQGGNMAFWSYGGKLQVGEDSALIGLKVKYLSKVYAVIFTIFILSGKLMSKTLPEHNQ